MTIVSSLYLSTDSGYSTSPTIISKANLANVSWLIDWDNIFHGKTGLCKISVNMVSKKNTATTDTWNSKVGTISANFTSPYAMNNNGFSLTTLNRNQYVEITTDTNSNTITAYVSYFQSNNTQNTVLPVINIPTGKREFTISMTDSTGALISSFPEYNIFLYFEWLEQKNLYNI